MHPQAKSSPIPPLGGRTSSEDAWVAEDVFVSWQRRWSGPDVLGHGAGVLLPDVLRSDLQVDHGGLNLCMAHEMHQRREANAGPEHVRSEGVPKPMRVRLRDACGLAVMTEQGTQTGGCHPGAARRPFEANE